MGRGLVDWGGARIDGERPGGLGRCENWGEAWWIGEMRELMGRGLVDWGDARIDGERPGGLGRCEN